MSDKVKYISLDRDNGINQQKELLRQIVGQLAAAMEKEMQENAGFLRLRHVKTGMDFYYNRKICGIIGNLRSLPELLMESGTVSATKEILEKHAKHPVVNIGPFQADVMKKEEYQVVFLNEAYERQREKNGWPDMNSIHIGVTEPPFYYGPEHLPVNLIRIFRCKDKGMAITPYTAASVLFYKFLRLRMIPIALFAMQDESRKILLSNLKNRGNMPVLRTSSMELDKIKKHFKEIDFLAAALPVYDDTIFQKARGSWDLYPFVGIEEADVKKRDGIWYEVDGLYARNPALDASAAEQVAIDFGTKSTTVAVYDGKNITLIPIGTMEELGEKAFENPTVMEFRDIRQFMEAYKRSEFRPDTRFDHISVSHAAMADYEDASKQKDAQMYQYLDHLKQWVDHPDSMLEAVDSCGEEVKLERTGIDLNPKMLNPIEIYAYYIGRNINNMHHGKVYLKYLLSYTSTYVEKDREWIRASFEKGLRKSLPPQVGTNAKLMKQFEVKLWRDEASAYAISALNRYIEQDCYINQNKSEYIEALKGEGIFYGVYDLGGGTLDLVFGCMSQLEDEDGEREVYNRLKCGGSPNLGCENLLEELAYKIFCSEENRMILWDKKIKCEKPFLKGVQHNEYQIAGHSNAARFNTNSLINYLREFWIKGKKKELFRLQDEKGTSYDVTLKEDSRADSKVIQLKMSDKEIEEFFREKVSEGVDLFIQLYKEVLKDNKNLEDKTCFLFLAGNASRAARVKECMDEKLQKAGFADNFSIQPCLPTNRDVKNQKEHPEISIPTAKSGVVFGMLLSRPGASEIEVIDNLPAMHFRYHVGRRKRDWAHAEKGLFQLLLQADHMPDADSAYHFLMKVPRSVFEILYTNDGQYVRQNDLLPVGNEVYSMTIQIPEQYAEKKYLYVRARPDCADEMEVGISDEKSKFLDQVNIAGICNFKKSEFQPCEMEEDADPCMNFDMDTLMDIRTEQKSDTEDYTDADVQTEQVHFLGYDVCIKENGVTRFERRILADDNIDLELLFETDSEQLEYYAKPYLESGTGQQPGFGNEKPIRIDLGHGNITKEIFLIKDKMDSSQVGIGCSMNGEHILYIIDMETRSVRIDSM